VTHVTVLGASGFIGSRLANALRRRGFTVATPPRDADLADCDLGLVFYCIGLTGDASRRPHDTVVAHVGKVADVLRRSRFDRLVYLSSTRLYLGAQTGRETQTLQIDPGDPGRLFNISKLTGETLVLDSGRGRIARLSNVYGPDWLSENFLTTIVHAACQDGHVTLRDAADSAKDYVHVDDVVEALTEIGLDGHHPLYNLASGGNVTHGEIAAELQRATGCRIEFGSQPRTVVFPEIDTTRLRADFSFAPRHVLDDMGWLVDECRAWLRRSAAPAAE
jgi:nucleoside-diphosphate-sugar epimerase